MKYNKCIAEEGHMLRNAYSALALALAFSLLAGCKNPTKGAPSAPSTTYTITYDANGATSGTVPTDGKQYRANESVTVKGNTGNLERVGWRFLGWADTQAATRAEYQAGNKFKITKSLTLYAVWEGKPYTISFDKNHRGAGGTQAGKSAVFGTPVTLPAATTFTPPSGMRFLGWATSPTGTAIVGEYNPSNYNATATLYARWGGKVYTINFDKNHRGAGGTQAGRSAVFGTPVTPPHTTTFTPPPGMRFLGWATSPTGTAIGRAYNPSVYSPTVTLYARWARAYTMIFDKNHREAGGTQFSLVNLPFGTPVTLPIVTTFTPPPGMRFLGWATSPTGTAIRGAYNPSVHRATVTLYALWGGRPYTISFDSNGGRGTQADKSAVFGTSVTLPATTTFTPPSGKRFLGWATSPTGTAIRGAYNPSGYGATVTLYAVWEGRSYTINFNSNGGRGTQAGKSAVFGTPVTLPATTTFTPPPGKRFLGWATSPTGTAIRGAYNPSGYGATVTLYAVWEGRSYTISFDSNGGRGTQADTSAVFGTPVTLPATTTFTPPSGMRFLGWAESSTGTVIVGEYNPSNYSSTVTLYAKWARAYIISFDSNGGSGTQASFNAAFGTPVTLPATTTFTPPPGKRFLGWAESSTGTVIGGAYNPNVYSLTVTLYARWARTYTIGFNSNGGGGTQTSLSATFRTSVTLPATTSFTPPSGKRFLGWAETSTGTAIVGKYNPSVYSATVTLYALWGDAAYTISFNSNGGRGTQADKSANFGTPVTLPSATTFTPPSGKRFLGWAETSTGTAIVGEYNPSVYSATVTLYARWGDAAYTISFEKNHGRAGGTQAGKNAVFGTPVTLPSATTFTPPSGMRFLGWATSPTGTAIRGAYNPSVYSATVTLYARWVRKTIAGNRFWTSIAMSSDGYKLAAVTNSPWGGGHIYTSTNGGETWVDRSTAGSAIGGNKQWNFIAMSSDGTKLAAVVYGGHLYTSTDSGETWVDRGTAGSAIAGNKLWISIAISSDGQKLAAAEYEGHIYTSTDSGATWTERTVAGSRNWYSIAISGNGQKLAAVVNSGHLYTSSDGGVTWVDRSTAGSAIGGNKRWNFIAISSDGAELAAVVHGGYLYTSLNRGVSWMNRGASANSEIRGHRGWDSVVMSSDGSKLTAVIYGGHLYTSTDSGATWRNRSE